MTGLGGARNEDEVRSAQVIGGSHIRLNSNTRAIDTMGTKIKDTVVLVCLGDSRGFVHMNHLILK